jgi:hypothetical protein
VNPWRECECGCECQCEWRGRLLYCVYLGQVLVGTRSILLSYTGGWYSRPQGLPNHPCQSSWLPPNKAKLTPSNYAARTLHTLLPCLYITAHTIPRLHLGTYPFVRPQFNSIQLNPITLPYRSSRYLRSLSHSETSLSSQQFIPVS